MENYWKSPCIHHGKKSYIVNNACYLMTGENLLHILAFLNSSPLIWYSEKFVEWIFRSKDESFTGFNP